MILHWTPKTYHKVVLLTLAVVLALTLAFAMTPSVYAGLDDDGGKCVAVCVGDKGMPPENR